MTWAFLALLAVFLWACSNIVDKYVLSKLISNPAVPLIIWSAVGFIVGLTFFVLRIAEPAPWSIVFWALGGGVLAAGSVLCYFKAVSIADISRVVPLYYLSPIFVAALAGFFLGEIFTLSTYIGIFMVVSGAILLSQPGSIRFIGGRPLGIMLCGSFLYGAGEVLNKYLLQFASVSTLFAYMRIGAFLVCLPLFFKYLPVLKKVYRERGAGLYGLLSANELLFGLSGTFVLIMAVNNGPVTLVNAMASFQPFFVLLFSVVISIFRPHILKEEITRSNIIMKFCAILLMFTGAILVN